MLSVLACSHLLSLARPGGPTAVRLTTATATSSSLSYPTEAAGVILSIPPAPLLLELVLTVLLLVHPRHSVVPTYFIPIFFAVLVACRFLDPLLPINMLSLYPDNLQSLLDASSHASTRIEAATPEESVTLQSSPTSPRCIVPKRRSFEDDGQSELTDDFTAKRPASSPEETSSTLPFFIDPAMLASFQIPPMPVSLPMPQIQTAYHMPFFNTPPSSHVFTSQYPGFAPTMPFFSQAPAVFAPSQSAAPPFSFPYLPNPYTTTSALHMPVPITTVPANGLQSLFPSDAMQPGHIDPVAVKVLASQGSDAPHSNSIQGRAPNKVLTYAALITMAIMTMPGHRAKIHDIYRFIENHRFMVPDLPDNWKLSVRHNLSSRDCFLKITDGCSARNSWWGINESALPMAAKLVADLENLRSLPATA